MADDKTKRTWISVAVAIVIILFLLAASLVGGAAFWIRRHVHTETTSPEAAITEFERARARFAGQQPLIELQDDHDRTVVHRRTASSRVEITALHVLAFDPDQNKIVRVTLPFWLLRLAPSGRFNLGNRGVDIDTERMHLTVDDLERAGPGLVLDGRGSRDGERVLVWTE